MLGISIFGFRDVIRYDATVLNGKIIAYAIGIGEEKNNPQSFRDFHDISLSGDRVIRSVPRQK
jgi:hypothetical protein